MVFGPRRPCSTYLTQDSRAILLNYFFLKPTLSKPLNALRRLSPPPTCSCAHTPLLISSGSLNLSGSRSEGVYSSIPLAAFRPGASSTPPSHRQRLVLPLLLVALSPLSLPPFTSSVAPRIGFFNSFVTAASIPPPYNLSIHSCSISHYFASE